MIYIASPYSDPSAMVREARFRAVCRHAAEMMRKGEHVFSPIAHCHPLAEHGLPGDWAFWCEYDRAMLSRCTRLVVLKLPGWDKSDGVKAEIEIAREVGLPVDYQEGHAA